MKKLSIYLKTRKRLHTVDEMDEDAELAKLAAAAAEVISNWHVRRVTFGTNRQSEKRVSTLKL